MTWKDVTLSQGNGEKRMEAMDWPVSKLQDALRSKLTGQCSCEANSLSKQSISGFRLFVALRISNRIEF